MRELAAYSTTLVTLSLVVTRPLLVWRRWPFARTPHRAPADAADAAAPVDAANAHTMRLSPALAMLLGVAVLYFAGFGSTAQLSFAANTMWRPLLTIAAMLVLTDEIARAGVLQTLATEIDRRARTTTALFTWVYWSSAAIAALLSNDAAILVMTPLVIGLVRTRFSQSTPTQTARIVWPFALAVFMAAGIAPLPTSNPMNLVMTQMAGISAGHYVSRMGPVAVAACAATYLLLRVMFHAILRAADRDAHRARLHDGPATQPVRATFTRTQFYLVGLLLVVLASVAIAPVIAVPTWIIALTGAALAKMVSLAAPSTLPARPTATRDSDEGQQPTLRVGQERSRWRFHWQQLASAMALETLAFVFLALLLAQALAAAGLLTRLTAAYQHASVATIATYSAFGSALINNHPMSQLNMLALADHASANSIFAALIGGDLGPRMLPIGSLAGMLWVAQLRKYDVAFSFRDFVKVGLLLAGVTIALAIVLLG